LPVVGSYIHLDVERIVALKPDLCIGIRDGNPVEVVGQLESLGIPVFAVDPQNLGSVMDGMLAIGGLLGVKTRAAEIVSAMRARIDAVKARVARATGRPRLFFQIGVSPIVSVGDNTFLDELITLAGGRNVALGRTAYPRFSLEQVIALAPEVIVITSMARQADFEQVKAQWRKWPAIPAVAQGAVHVVSSNLFDRPGPRLVEALEVLAGLIHPESAELDPGPEGLGANKLGGLRGPVVSGPQVASAGKPLSDGENP